MTAPQNPADAEHDAVEHENARVDAYIERRFGLPPERPGPPPTVPAPTPAPDAAAAPTEPTEDEQFEAYFHAHFGVRST